MSWRYTGLSTLLMFTSLAIRLPLYFTPTEPIQPSWLQPPSYEDPEGRLAMGLKLPLECADMWSLELLKGVSDKLALELIDKRYEIMRTAFTKSQVEAIKKAHGIGDKTAEKLLRYLDLTERCHLNEPYEVWHKRRP